MKRIVQTLAFALVLVLGSSWRQTASAQPEYDDYGDGDISYQDFYDELSPHGRWIQYPDYGYVWAPNGISGFRPYETGGRWVWTDDYQWMWVSDYSWGWAPFHYGRWFYDPFYGWMWVPGYEWAPAWVAWRDGGDYYGWAPLRPGFNLSININLGGYNPPVDYWCFAPRRYISSPRIYNYCVDRSRNVTIINNTTIINNYRRTNNVFVNGPRRGDAERYAGRINPVRFRQASRPGRTIARNNEVSVYRPRVRQNNDRQFSPRSFDRYERNGNAGNRNNEIRNRSNGNNLPDRRERNTVFERRNTNGQNGDNNRSSDRRNIFERRNSQPQGNNDRNRREIFNRRNEQPNAGQQRQEQRRNSPFTQRNNEARQGRDNEVRQQQQRQNEMRQQQQRQNEARQRQEQQRTERRNVFERRGNASQTQSRPEVRGNRTERPQAQPRQSSPQRQLGNRGGNENRGGNDRNGNGRERRGRNN